MKYVCPYAAMQVCRTRPVTHSLTNRVTRDGNFAYNHIYMEDPYLIYPRHISDIYYLASSMCQTYLMRNAYFMQMLCKSQAIFRQISSLS